MSETGSLIRLHHHNNFDILQEITDEEGKFYYKGLPIYIHVSEEEHNAIIKKEDGIFVDNSYFLNSTQYDVLTKFNIRDTVLYYNNTEVGMNYHDTAIRVIVDLVWSQLNLEYPVDDYPTGYLVMLTSDSQEFITADGQEFIPKE